jgi:SAM-dependent methyltransferase
MYSDLRPRPDFEVTRRFCGDTRSPERIEAHYRLERSLADRLRSAPARERTKVYTEVYEELFASLPDHPMVAKHRVPDSTGVARKLKAFSPYLHPTTRFLELGCGDAALAFAAADIVGTAYGLDVTDALIDYPSAPANFKFVRTAGVEIPLATASIDFAMSDALIEHLHPADAKAQLREVRRVLMRGGRYRCSTPNRFVGPSDVSGYYDYTPTCFHLIEYSYRSLTELMLSAGFRSVEFKAPVHGRDIPISATLAGALETSLSLLSPHLRAKITQFKLMKMCMGITAIALS